MIRWALQFPLCVVRCASSMDFTLKGFGVTQLTCGCPFPPPCFSCQEGKRILVFSYGSGLMSTLFSFKVLSGSPSFSLSNLLLHLDVNGLLERRNKVGS